MLRANKHISIPSSFVVFTFGLNFESYKEFKDVSRKIIENGKNPHTTIKKNMFFMKRN
jgi:hypothetical protein